MASASLADVRTSSATAARSRIAVGRAAPGEEPHILPVQLPGNLEQSSGNLLRGPLGSKRRAHPENAQ